MEPAARSRALLGLLILATTLQFSHGITTTTPPVTTPAPGATYLGCYRDINRRRVLSQNPGGIKPELTTPLKCRNACGLMKFAYSGLDGGNVCMCGDTLANLALVSSSFCNIDCAGDANFKCGGQRHISVYLSEVPYDIEVDVVTKQVVTGANVGFIMTPDTAAPSYSIRADYGDKAGKSEYRNLGTGLNAKTFHQAGRFRVTMFITSPDQGVPDVESSTSVDVEAAAVGLTITCPPYAATFTLGACVVEVARGTGLNMTFTYTQGETTPTTTGPITHQIGDAQEFFLGNGVQEKLTDGVTLLSGPTTGQVVYTSNSAVDAGKLIGFELNAINTGNVDVRIFQPVCNTGTAYCAVRNLCMPVGMCAVPCPTCEVCLDTKTCSDLSPVVPAPWIQAPSYSQVYSQTLVVTSVGLNYFGVTNPLPDIPVGSVLSHSTTNPPVIGINGLWTGPTVECLTNIAPGSAFTPGDCTPQTTNHQLKAIYSRPSMSKVPLNYTRKGPSTVSVSVFNVNPVTGPNTMTDSTTLMVYEGVDRCSPFLTNQCLEINVADDINLLPFTGNEVNVNWDFGDGTPIEDITNPNTALLRQVLHTYTTVGHFIVAINISNFISWKSNTLAVCTQERITGLNITFPPTYTYIATGTTNGMVTMTTGTNYTCTVTTTYPDLTQDSYSLDYTVLASGDSLQFDFPESGNAVVSISCSNFINTAVKTVNLLVIEPITGVHLSPTGAGRYKIFSIGVAWDTGSHVTVEKVTYNITEDITLTMSYDFPFSKLTTSSMEKNESATGIIPIGYRLSNLLGVNNGTLPFVIEVAITRPNLTCKFAGDMLIPGYKVIPVDTSTACYVDMEAGTSVTVEVNFGDGTSITPFYFGFGNPFNRASLPVPYMHTYAIPGTYNCSVRVWNNFNSRTVWYITKVLVPITNVEVDAVPPSRHVPPALVTLYFTVTSGKDPVIADFRVSWGDGMSTTHLDTDLTAGIPHSYAIVPGDKGYADISITVWNLVSTKTLTVRADIITPIINSICTTDPIATTPGSTVDIIWMALRAPGPKGATINFNCGTGITSGPLLRTAESPDGEDRFACTYPNRGNFTVDALASSPIEDITCPSYILEVMYPVTEQFTTVTNYPMDWHAVTNKCLLSLRFNYFGTPLPDRAFFDIDYGDGSAKEIKTPFTTSFGRTHQYASDGNWMTTIRIYNKATEVIRVIPTGCFKMFTDLIITVVRQPNDPIDAPYEPGYGDLQNKFRSDEAIILLPSTTQGTISYITSNTFMNGSATTYNYVSDNPNELPFFINEFGYYDLEIQAFNPLYISPVVFTEIEIMVPVIGLQIYNDFVPISAYDKKYIDISFDSHGSAMCVAVYSAEPSEQFIYAYGDYSTCNDGTKYEEFPEYDLQYDQSVDVSKPFTFNTQYFAEGSYTMQIYAWNAFSDVYGTTMAIVSSIDCSAPNIDIKQRCRIPRYATSFKMSRRIKIIGITDIKCPDTLINTKQWRMWLWNMTSNRVLKSIDITSLASSRKAELSFDPLYFQRYGYGTYKLNYKVTMNATGPGSPEFSGDSSTFIKVDKSDLVVQLFANGNSLKTVGLGEIVTIDPQENSYDPDTAGTVQWFDNFELACIDVTAGEDWSTCTSMAQPMNLTSLPIGWVSRGGCFRTGCGFIKPFVRTLTFSTDIFEVGHEYQFFARGYKDTRVAQSYGTYKVVPGTPPKMTISSKMQSGQAAGGMLINPNSQLGLLAQIVDPCTYGCTYTYEWQFCAIDHNYCLISDCLNCLDSYNDYIFGKDTDELTVVADLFKIVPKKQFLAKLNVTIAGTPTYGETMVNLTLNQPPLDGNCSIEPSYGLALLSNFSITCENFVDAEGSVESYIISCMSEGKEYIVAQGSVTYWEGKFLPKGDVNNSFSLQCYVTVTDDGGAMAKYPLPLVTVEELTIGDLRSEIAEAAFSDNGSYAMADAVADLQQTSSLTSAQASMVPTYLHTCEFAEDRRTALDLTPTSLDDEVRDNAFSISAENSTNSEFEEERAHFAMVTEFLFATFMKCTRESPEDIETSMSSLALLTEGYSLLSQTAQEAVLSVMAEDVSRLVKAKESMTVEIAKSIYGLIVKTCSNLKVAAAFSTTTPMMLEVNRTDPALFSTSLYSTVPDLPDETRNMTEEEIFLLARGLMNQDAQNQTAQKVMKQCYTFEDVSLATLCEKLPVHETPVEFTSGTVVQAIYKNHAKNLQNRTLTLSGMDFVVSPSVLPSYLKEHVVVIVLTVKSSIGLPPSGDTSAAEHSRSLDARFLFSNGTKIIVNKKPMLMSIKRDPNLPKANLTDLPFVDPFIAENDAFFYQQFTVSSRHSAIRIRAIFNETRPDLQIMGLVSYEDVPFLGENSNVEYVCLFPRTVEFYDGPELAPTDEPAPYDCFIDADIINDRQGSWKLAFAQVPVENLDIYTKPSRLPPYLPTSWINGTFEVNWSMYIEELSCPYIEHGEAEFKFDGAKPHWTSTEEVLVCETTHLTSFAGGWVVAPNAIDFNHVFANADFLSNPTLYITEMVIGVAYIIAMIWARRKDRQDVTKLGLAPLLDNDPKDKYYYEIMVETGMRRNAGTESKVHFILSGEEEETEVRTFTDKKRKIFERGATDGFLMAVSSPLGALMYLRIWHDNSGKGPMASWYLNYIIIRDIQTDKKYFFICNRWFAVEEDDGQVDRVIPVAGKEQMTEFSHLFKERAQKNLSDGHLWFSVVARPPQSRFTRCQRVSCCLSLLFTTMLANAMFYKTEKSDSNAYTFGPFAVTPEQIFIGIASNLIIFPVNFLLITIFRKSRPRKLRPSRVEEALKSMPERSTSVNDLNVRVNSAMSIQRPGSNLLKEANAGSRPYSGMSMRQQNKMQKKKQKCELPWGFTIVGWILLWVTVLTSAFFVTMYGIQFGDMKCKKWITSMMISFFTSVFLTQPLKVFLFAIVFSLIIKNPGGDEEEDDDEEEHKPASDEEYLHTEADGYSSMGPMKAVSKPKPPNSKSLEAMRKQRLKEIQMWSVIREILLYAIYLMILLVISYRNVSINSYRYKHNMERVFIYTNDTDHAFTEMVNIEDYWTWARSGMLRGLQAGPYYNNYPPFYLRGYIDDKSSRILGYAVLRQVRVRPGSCRVAKQMQSVIDECNEEYDSSTEDTRNFGIGWSTNVSVTREEYQYIDASSLGGYPFIGEMAVYGGGGYVIKLNKDYSDLVNDFKRLEQERWIDEYTRAVFLEFTVYNPAVNMFAISNLLAEFRPSGGVFPSYRFEPCMLLPYMNSVLLFQIACEIAYFAFTLYFLIKEIRNIWRQKWAYFRDFWNLIEFSIACMSITAIVIYFYRMICINELTEYFQKTKGDGYMKFQYVGYWTEIFMYIVGFLVFFATLKFLKLLRFNKKISMLTSVLSNSGRDLIHFGIIFNIVFMAFIQFFYLLYHANLDVFKTFVSSCEAGIVMMMGKFDIYNMIAVNSWLTQIFIFLFVLSITFIVVNMFLSILNETFGAVREDIAKQQNDYEIVDFMVNRFKLWTGMGRAKSTTISPEKLERKRQKEELEAKINALPDQIDKFLASVSAMYLDKTKFDTQMDKDIYSKMAMKVQQYDSELPRQPGPAPHGGQRLSVGSGRMTDIDTH